MKTTLFLLLTLLLVNSCSMYRDIEFKGLSGFKMDKFEKGKMSFQVSLSISNPNFYAVKIKPSTVDLLFDDLLMGKICLDEKVKVIRKKNGDYGLISHIELADGILLKLMRYVGKDKINVQLRGKVKGSLCGLPKRVEIDEQYEISGEKLKLNSILGKIMGKE